MKITFFCDLTVCKNGGNTFLENVSIYQTILCHVPEHAYINTQCRENLKPHTERNIWYLHITFANYFQTNYQHGQ
jgi:hypothetical protein